MAVQVQGNQLLIYSEDVDKEMSCVPLGNTRFACDVGLIEFDVAPDGSVPSLRFGKVYTLRRVSPPHTE
jgi:hypothetical protein